VVVDRIFVLGLIGVVYFQVGPPTTWSLVVIFGLAIALFVYTTPFRYGFCIGLVNGLAPRWRVVPAEEEDEASSR